MARFISRTTPWFNSGPAAHPCRRNHVFESQRTRCEKEFSRFFPDAHLLAVADWLRPAFNRSFDIPRFSSLILPDQDHLMLRYENSRSTQDLAHVDNYSLTVHNNSLQPRFVVSRMPQSLFSQISNSPLARDSHESLGYLATSVLPRLFYEGRWHFLLQLLDSKLISKVPGFRVLHQSEAGNIAGQISGQVRSMDAVINTEPEPYAITARPDGVFMCYVLHYLATIEPPESGYPRFLNGSAPLVLMDANPEVLADSVRNLPGAYDTNPDILASLFCAGCRMHGWMS